MKITDSKKEDVITIGLDESDVHEAKIDPSQMAWIMNILSSNYKDKYGIVVQEYASNAWDSHVEAGCTDTSIIIRMLYLDEEAKEKPALQILDKGMGMSPDRIKIFGNYGTSTKRNTNDQLGGFGIGSKSGYAYSDSFYVNTTYDGVHYKYLCAKNDKNIPQTNLLNTYNVDESNRTMITFMIKNENDIDSFYDAIIRKTLYFENINYDISQDIIDGIKDRNKYSYSSRKPDSYWEIANNTLYEIEDTDFCLLENSPYDKVHLILGQIPYKLDFNLLNKVVLNVPIGIRVNLDIVKPIPTREDIDYTPEAIKFINSKIDELAEYLKDKFNDHEAHVYDDFKDYVQALNNYRTKNKIVKLGPVDLPLSARMYFGDLEYKKPIYSELDLLKDDIGYYNINSYLDPIKVIKEIIWDSYSALKSDLIFNYRLYESNRFLRIDKGFNKSQRIKNAYLYRHDYTRVYLIRNDINKLTLKDYIRILSLKYKDKSKWRATIKQYQAFINKLFNSYDHYDDIEPDEDFINEYNEKRKLDRLSRGIYKPTKKENDLITYNCRTSDRGNSLVWDKVYQPYSKLFKEQQFIVYAKTKHKDAIKEFVTNFEFTMKNLKFITVNQGKFDLLSIQPNFIKFKNFMTKESKPFIRGITCYVIHQMFYKYKEVLTDNIKYIKLLSINVYNDIKELEDYLTKYSSLRYYDKDAYLKANKFMDAAVLQHPELDYKIADVISRVDNYVEVLDYLKYLKRVERYNDNLDIETLRLAEIIIKKVPGNHKFRLNLHHYQNGGTERLIQKYFDLRKNLDHYQVINKLTDYVEQKEI